MFGTIGGPELLLILVIALIVFGPRKLPDIGKSVGRMMAEFKKASNDFKKTIEDEVEAEKLKEALSIPPDGPSVAPPSSDSPPGAPPASEPPSSEMLTSESPIEEPSVPEVPEAADEPAGTRAGAPPLEAK